MTALHTKRTAELVLCFVAAFLGVFPSLAFGGKASSAASDSSGYTRSVAFYSVPNVTLMDSDSRPVRLRELLESTDPVMVNFIFTTCGTICPIMVKVFSELPSALGSDATKVRMISISIDPENDTPARLRAYARDHSVEGTRWWFLTGRSQDIQAVQRAFSSYRGDKMNHEPVTLLHTSAGRPWVRIDGFASPTELANEYRKAALK